MRASRYPVHLVVLYQPVGDIEWREGEAVDISSSGVLFRVEDPLPLGTPVQFRFVLPLVGRAKQHGEICGKGRVARLAGPPAASDWRCAVAIEEYEFKQGPQTWDATP